MLSTIKFYIYGGLVAIIGIFIAVFKMRGAKIEELQEKVNVAKKKSETDIMVAKFEARNKQKKEDVKHENIDDLVDGTYTL